MPERVSFLPAESGDDLQRARRAPALLMEPIILNSWKEIAQYVGRGVRTVERWERQLGLPVRRLHNRARSPVSAISSEIDEWLASGRPKSVQANRHVPSRVELKHRIAKLRANTKLLRRNRELMLQDVEELQKAIIRIRKCGGRNPQK